MAHSFSRVAVATWAVCFSGCVELLAPTPSERLVGSWDWVESTGGITGGTRTPASTGETLMMRFLEDDSVEVYRNGDRVAASRYALLDSGAGSPLRVGYDQPVLGFSSQEVGFPEPSALALTDPCCDGFTYRFVRATP